MRSLLLWSLVGYFGSRCAADLSFASLGNWGNESLVQKNVGAIMKARSHEDKIGLIISPGSNFVQGVKDSEDPKWERLFEDVYCDEAGSLKVPFMPVLGMGDWQGGGHQAEVARSDYKSDTTLNCPQWSMPNYWYHYIRHFQASTASNAVMGFTSTDRSVGFIFIDTWILNSNFNRSDITRKAFEDLALTLANAKKVLDFIIVVGDAPIFSSGSLGGDSGLKRRVLPLFEDAQIDAYISGADGHMEIQEVNGISHINCGSGARSTGNRKHSKATVFYTGQAGYCLHRLSADAFHTEIITASGQTDDKGNPVGTVAFSHQSAIKKRPDKSSVRSLVAFNAMPTVETIDIPTVGTLPARDLFVKTIGTIGFLIGTIFTGLFIAQLAAKSTK